MRIVYVGPSYIDDKSVHAVMMRRIELAKALANHRAIDAKSNDERYLDFLVSVQSAIGENIEDIGCVVPTSFGCMEDDVLDGSWAGQREFHDVHLDGLWHQLRLAVGDGALVHIDLGRQLAPLYAAYFVSRMDNAPFTIGFHAPPDGLPFTLGGRSVYAQRHPNLRRKLASIALRKAEHVFVSHEGIAAAMAQLFPRIERPYASDPLVGEVSEAEQTSLLSQVGGSA